MSEPRSEPESGLGSLEAIRTQFEERQRTLGKGFHALGEEVFAAYWQAQERLPKPASAMTFRNFLQGKTVLRDPTALELYFRALGATDHEMRVIRATLQQELDRKLATPRQQAALRALDDFDLAAMPYSRALVECEVITKLEDSVDAPITHLTPREYLLGPDGQRDAGPDPERWGLVQHLEEFTLYIAKLDQTLADELEALPRRNVQQRRLQAYADLREVASAYAHWLLYRPRAADLLFSKRRYMLHGFFPEGQREAAIALAKRATRTMFGVVERLAIEAVLQGKHRVELLRTPQAERALEGVSERLFAMVNSFFLMVVHGSSGTGAMFQASYQLRREHKGLSNGLSEIHEQLITSYDEAVRKANRALDEDVRIPYAKLKEIYDRQFDEIRPAMVEIWKREYAPHLVRQTLSLMLSELHEAGALNDKEFLSLTKELMTGADAKKALLAKHPDNRYKRIEMTPKAGKGPASK
ncbi:MAG: hypothetical protein QM778_18985 [Myxococcales bacterium]